MMGAVAHRIEGELIEHDSFEDLGYDVELFHVVCADKGRELFVQIFEEDNNVLSGELDPAELPTCPVCHEVINLDPYNKRGSK